MGSKLKLLAKITKTLLSGYIAFAKAIPADLAIFLGVGLNQFKWIAMLKIDDTKWYGAAISFSWDVLATYFVISGVILYFSRYFIRRHERRRR